MPLRIGQALVVRARLDRSGVVAVRAGQRAEDKEGEGGHGWEMERWQVKDECWRDMVVQGRV